MKFEQAPVNQLRTPAEAAAYISALCESTKESWRLPNIKELESINLAEFASVPIGKFWSSTQDTAGGFWTIDTSSGMTSTEPSTARCFVWAVLGVEQPMHDWQIDGGTVTDGRTGLTWRRDHEMVDPLQPNDWETRINRVRWEDVPALCVNGWRLPTAQELRGIVDERFSNPAIDVNVFSPPPFQSLFWTSTVAHDAYQNPDLVMCVNFGIGVSLPTTTHGKAYVRLVRDSGIIPTPAPLPTPAPTPAPSPQPAPEPLPVPAPTPGTVTYTALERAAMFAHLDAVRAMLSKS